MAKIVLFTKERAEAASLRHWGRHDAHRLALAIAWQRYTEQDALAELATTLAWHAEQAGIKNVSCRALAASMLDDALYPIEREQNAVLQKMIEAAEKPLRENRRAAFQAAMAAADVARDAQVPPYLIDSAVKIARWRTRRIA